MPYPAPNPLQRDTSPAHRLMTEHPALGALREALHVRRMSAANDTATAALIERTFAMSLRWGQSD